MKKNKETESILGENNNDTKNPGKIKSFLKSRNAKRGTAAIVLTILFVVSIVGLNIVAKLLTERYPVLSSDLTSNNVYELTDSSAEHIQKLEDEVTIYVLLDEQTLEAQGEYYVQTNKLLHQFDKHSKNIKLKYVDLSKKPSFTTPYTKVDWTDSHMMLIECGDNYVAVDFEDVFSYNEESLAYYGEYVVDGQHLEQAVLSAILNVTTKDKITITFLAGHGEYQSESFVSLLSNNAYTVESVNLINGKISEDSRFVVIFAPTNDIDKDTYDTLVDWLYNDGEYGRTLLYVPNDANTEMPYIDALLEEWGMSVNRSWIYETDMMYMTNSVDPNRISIYNFDETEFAGGLRDTTIPVVLMYCMPIELLDTGVTSLLSSSDYAVKMPVDAPEDWDYQDHEPEKLIGAAISTQGNEDATKSSNMIVVGSYAAFSDVALSTTSFNNSAYFLNIFNTIAQRDDISITVESKNLDAKEIGITSNFTAISLAVLLRYIIPLVVVVVGVIVWLRRRHK